MMEDGIAVEDAAGIDLWLRSPSFVSYVNV